MLLNVIWAAATVLLEVPSGALADTIGRRKLVVFAATLSLFFLFVYLTRSKRGSGVSP